jgi:hypothetical protein
LTKAVQDVHKKTKNQSTGYWKKIKAFPILVLGYIIGYTVVTIIILL